jgi:hypothetical protein
MKYLPFLLVFMLCHCSQTSYERQKKYTAMNSWEREDIKKPDRLLGDSMTFGQSNKNKSFSESGMGVNSFLWRASLDTLSFMPLNQIEPFTGVITTDWYTPPEVKKERFKITVLILDKVLRADAVRVSVFHETYESEQGWTSASIDPNLNDQLEETILARARELKQEMNPRAL